MSEKTTKDKCLFLRQALVREVFGLPRCIFPLKFLVDLEFPLCHASDSVFGAI